MLNYSDQQRKFDNLRAHWAAAELDEQRQEMVVRRERQMPRNMVHDEAQHNPGSKFRRKLSNGLAFISLTQRKNVPPRHPSSNASLTMSAQSTNDSSNAIISHDAQLSTSVDLNPATTCSDPPALPVRTIPTCEGIPTSTPLPRSRTFSNIPRPIKADGERMSVVEIDESEKATQQTVMPDSNLLPSTRIPTPRPPQSKRRVSSPRQYLPSNTPLQARPTGNRQSLSNIANGHPAKAVVRSQTTPNLLKADNTPQSADYIAPRRPGLKRPFASSAPQRPVLAENVPTAKRVSQRDSQMQDRPVKRESLAVPSAAFSRRSYAPGTPLVQSKRYSLAPPASTKRLSMHTTQKPATAKHTSIELQGDTHDTEKARLLKDTSVTRPESTTSDNSLTPTVATINVDEPLLALPPYLNVDDGTQGRTLGTPNGLSARTGAWRSSKVFAAANHQVRRLPRSSTFHHFGQQGTPPVPTIPNQYKSPSTSILTHPSPRQPSSKSFPFWHRRPVVPSSKFGPSSKSLLSEIAIAQRKTEAASLQSVPTSTPTATSRTPEPDNDAHLDRSSAVSPGTSTSMEGFKVIANCPPELTHSSTDALAFLSSSISVPRPRVLSGDLQTQRHWSISEHFYTDCADIPIHLQVKDYMPSLYWAGRFQSRFDQWRTEAMVAMLDAETKPEDEDLLGRYSIDDERKAKILIFMQLRDLCTSVQAADSLHEFEYRYRKDHKLLDTKFDLPPSLRKPEEATPKGPVGRAVRKLTPRKASFANLFKGKGWNRSDDTKAAAVSGHIRELQDITDSTMSYVSADADSYESRTRLHGF